MRRTLMLAAGAVAGLVLATAAQAAQDTSIFLYPPGQASTDGRPLVSPIERETISYDGPYSPGTIVVNTAERRLYLVLPGHEAIKYGVGVGRPGFAWAGHSRIANKREWPDWTPPPQMLKRRPDLPRHMEGGIGNPSAPAPCISPAPSIAFTARTSRTRSARPSRPAASG